MKYYAIRKGYKTGVVRTWEECSNLTTGYPNAEFKSFKTEAAALEYLNNEESITLENVNKPSVYAYVDGSYNVSTNTYGYGICLSMNGKKFTSKGAKSDEYSSMRNVAGELLGVKVLLEKLQGQVDEITIYYDYEGIAKWVSGEWKAKNDLTRSYAIYIREQDIKVNFVKVTAHSGVKGNELADKLAKEAVGLL